MRLISSSVFATDYSMRFPTVVRIRWDKPAAEVQTHEELVQLVRQQVESGACLIIFFSHHPYQLSPKRSARRLLQWLCQV